MRMLALALAVALFGAAASPALSDPRSPFSDDAIRNSAGIAAFTEVPPPASRVHTRFHYDTVHVAEGITTFIEAPSHAMVQGNITLIAGSKAALVIDSGHYPAVALRVIADMRKLTSTPVRYLAITHWHMDHFMANSQFAEEFPGLTIVAQNFTGPMMDKYGARYVN